MSDHTFRQLDKMFMINVIWWRHEKSPEVFSWRHTYICEIVADLCLETRHASRGKILLPIYR